MSTLVYLKNLVRDKNIASITPTSSFGIRRVCSKIDFNKCNVIVEYGPATGVFSKYLLDNIKSNSILILVEYNKNFVSVLRESIKDPRVIIFNDTAENLFEILHACNVDKTDYIISGIPFSFLTPNVKDKILKDSYKSLTKGGRFLAYQTFFQTDKQLRFYMENYFTTVCTEYELMNIPPLRIYEAIK